ncbi:hypothetical protein [Actinophytocola algeriensis]|uniref:DNA topoisomerase IB n=1 Tax=Actinophytocola algeriensis TaxID=1768010 RepID=A0A7W7QB33_9PSEU|nr:hypothetical protein [Actinophytocola algeriensis]MBB4910367.1 DNA topoisomerase IB [Actinophytocola algeriensis]MBE1480644.1 DNA topoisomerase IB [Actinophytocola algeriensis]
MTDPHVVKIDADMLGTHQKHLAALVDRVTTARDAAGTTLSSDAFGVFGGGLAAECIQSQREGADTLQVTLDASIVHHDNVGAWLRDLTTNELDLVAMFRVIGEGDV